MKDLLLRILRFFANRIFLLFLAITGMFILLWTCLYRIQVLEEEHYTRLAMANRYEEQEATPERGNIYDRYGRPLAINTVSQSLYYSPDTNVEDLTAMIQDLLKVMDENGETISLEVPFPIGYFEGNFYYKEGYREYDDIARLNFLAEIYNSSRAQLTDEQIQTSAKDAVRQIREKMFHIPDSVSDEDFLRIASIRYAIFSGRFDATKPVRIARNVSQKTIITLMERRSSFAGFSIQEEYTRIYPEGELFAHIVGYTGRISEEELERQTEKGLSYREDDIIGKSGLEASMEDVLRGKSGLKRIEISQETGERLNEVTLIPSYQGDSLFLTIDRDIQQMAYENLYKHIKTLLLEKITGESKKTDGIEPETYSLADVFTALIANHFIPSSVLDNSKGVYAGAFRQVYAVQASNTMDQLEETILVSNEYPLKEYPDYLKELYDLYIGQMRDYGRLSYDYQKDEKFYPDYAAGEISPYRFFEYCLQKHLLDEEAYGFTKDMDTEEKISKIFETERVILWQTAEFKNTMFRYLLSYGYFSETQFLYLLYEENLISDADGSLEALQYGEITPLDCLIQKIQQDEITPANINLDPCGGSCVVSDPNTGEILAMVSYPSYDPNRFTSDSDYYSMIVLDQSSPLTFRALNEMRAIGSTYKMCTAIAGLDTGTITKDTKIYDDFAFPYVHSADHPVCWSIYSHGDLTVTTALEHSCNYFFYDVGYLLSEPDENHEFDDDVGLKKLAAYALRLGLAEKTGIEIAEGEPHASDMDSVRTAIGQGTNAFSCANLNRYTCTLANGGTVYDLYLIDEIQSIYGETVQQTMPHVHRETGIPKETMDLVKEGMRLVVTGELPQYFYDLEQQGVRCAGKTGTAQEFYGRPDHSVFTGYTDVDHPTLCVSVFIPFGGGSSKAIPVFVDIVADYFRLFLTND